MPPIVQFAAEATREKDWDNIVAIHSGLATVTTWSYNKLRMGELKLLPKGTSDMNLPAKPEIVATCLCMTKCGNYVLIGFNSGHVDR